MSMLPPNWSYAPISAVADILDFRRVPLNGQERSARQGTYPYYGANGLIDHIDDFIFDGKHVLLAEDGGYFDDPNRDVAYCVEGRFWVNNHAHILAPVGGIKSDFLALAINSLDWMPYVSGTTRLKLTQAGMEKAFIPVPPLAEQDRMIEAINRISAYSKQSYQHLDCARALTSRFKKAILHIAFSGLLTKHWTNRKPQSTRSDIYKFADLCPDNRERGEWPFEILPNDWTWHRFEHFFEDVTDSRRKLTQRDYAQSGRFPVIDQGEIFIGGWTDEEFLVHKAPPPVIIFGDHTRCIKFINHKFVQGADGVKVLKSRHGIDMKFAYFALMAIDLPSKGYSRHMKILRATAFPRCSLEEQREIVRRIEHAFAAIDRLTAEAHSARERLKKLDQAILAKAFRGELVPQDPDDEPASVLLDRIRAGRAAAGPGPKRGRRPRAGAGA